MYQNPFSKQNIFKLPIDDYRYTKILQINMI